jgi:hypothetical protein
MNAKYLITTENVRRKIRGRTRKQTVWVVLHVGVVCGMFFNFNDATAWCDAH